MGAVTLSDVAAIKREWARERKVLEAQIVAEQKLVTTVVLESLFDRTPVWEGTAARNYVVGIGQVPSGSEKPAVGSGDPGPTGSMGAPPAGEPRRGANESAALSDAEAVLRGLRKPAPVYITNLAEHFDLVENGTAPTADRARNPGGVSVLAVQSARGKLGDRIE